MAAADDTRRVTLGFQGGQVLALRVSEQQLADLNKALGGIGWHDLGARTARCAWTSARSST